MRYRRVRALVSSCAPLYQGSTSHLFEVPQFVYILKSNIMTERTLILSNPYNRRAIAPATPNTSMERLMNLLIKKFDSLIDKFYQYTIG